MRRKHFEFCIFRLNIIDGQFKLLKKMNPIRSDEDIISILEKSSNRNYDKIQEAHTAKYKWSIRNIIYDSGCTKAPCIICTLSRSQLEKYGEIVTDDGVEDGLSESYPPLATSIFVIFYLDRHLVAVEQNSTITGSDAWKNFVCDILNSASIHSGFDSLFSLEVLSEPQKIVKEFKSFNKVTRLRVKLRLPNPEFTRFTKELSDEMKRDGMREYTQDIKNNHGISKSEEGRPFTSIALAEIGYKDGYVIISGVRNNKFERIVLGKTASRLTISMFRDEVRRMVANGQSGDLIKIVVDKINIKHPQEKKGDEE